MDIDFSAFHFLRPYWLLVMLAGLLLPLLWRRSHDLHRGLRATIAAHLLPHLLVNHEKRHRLRPIHLASALLVLGACAAAGPTWQQDRPDFIDNRAPLIIALDLSPSMDASDVPPTRLEAAKRKIHDLTLRRGTARTGLIAYAGSAHLVLPPSDDPALIDTFVQALGSDLIAQPGKNLAAVLDEAKRLLAADTLPATLLVISDGADTTQLAELPARLKGVDLQVLVLAVGSQNGGIVRAANGQPRNDANGRPERVTFDPAGLKQLASTLDAPLGSLTLNDDDLNWVEQHAQQHFERSDPQLQQLRWKDAGYWLVWPLLGLAFMCLRKGWNLNWLALLLVTLLSTPNAAQANGLTDAFLTPDQQGRWAFEHQHYPDAAAHFNDPYWKGIAAYRAVDYDLALACFAQLDTPQAYFYLGNIHLRRFHFNDAISAYRRALQLRAAFPEASANLALALALQKDNESAQQNAPQTKPDQTQFDKPAGKGQTKTLVTQQAASDAQWLENLGTSPARFLREKFRLQDQRASAAPGRNTP